MWEFIREINENGTTVLLTTHYLEEAEELCRNIAIIDRGAIIDNTSIKRLLATLNMETFVFDLDPNTVKNAVTLQGFQWRQVEEHTLEVEVEKSKGLNSVFEQLSQQQIQVLSMRNKANRLEELFVNLVEQGRQSGSKAGAK